MTKATEKKELQDFLFDALGDMVEPDEILVNTEDYEEPFIVIMRHPDASRQEIAREWRRQAKGTKWENLKPVIFDD